MRVDVASTRTDVSWLREREQTRGKRENDVATAQDKEVLATRGEIKRTAIRLVGATLAGGGVLYVVLHAAGVLP